MRQPKKSFPLATRKQRNGLSSHHTLSLEQVVLSSVMSEKRTTSSVLGTSHLGLIRCVLEVLMAEKTSWKERSTTKLGKLIDDNN